MEHGLAHDSVERLHVIERRSEEKIARDENSTGIIRCFKLFRYSWARRDEKLND